MLGDVDEQGNGAAVSATWRQKNVSFCSNHLRRRQNGRVDSPRDGKER